MKNYILYACLLILWACQSKTGEQNPENPEQQAQAIIDLAIEKQGGDLLSRSRISFDFRGRTYVSNRNGGSYTYERQFLDTLQNEVHDILSNEAFQRKIEGTVVALNSKDSSAYANSVNSVLYFAFLPYFLNDAAVKKAYLGEVNIKGQPYHKVKVGFEAAGGGKDFEDEYVYWFHKEKGSMDYLAYNYKVDGGGARFREAYNIRVIDGIRFADYINYKPNNKSMAVETFDELFEKGKMKELSRIDLENISVSRL